MKQLILLIFLTGVLNTSAYLQAAENNAALIEWETLLQKSHDAHQQWHLEEAIQWAQKSYDYARQHFGNQHEATVKSLVALARRLRDQGDYAQAEILYKQALSFFEVRHPSALNIRNNLASLYKKQGRYQEAKKEYEELLPLVTEILGPTDKRTLMLLDNMGDVYLQQGDYQLAEMHKKKASQLLEETLGLKNPDTLIAIMNFAFVYQVQKRYEEAETLYNKVLQASVELGSQHPITFPITVHVRDQLAQIHKQQGRDKLAKQQRKAVAQALGKEAIEEILTSEDNHTLPKLPTPAKDTVSTGEKDVSLPENLNHSREQAERKPVNEESIATEKASQEEKVLLPKNSSPQKTYQEAEQKLYQKAKTSVEKWEALLEKSMQAYQQGRFEESLEWAQKSYDYAIQHFGKQSLGTLKSLMTLAAAHHAKANFQQAESMYKEALILNESIKRAKTKSVETSVMLRNNLAGLYQNLGRYEEAKTAYEELLPLLKETIGLKDWRTLTTMSNLGEVYQALGDMPQAEKYFEQALNLMENLQDTDKPESLLVIMNNRALLSQVQGRYKDAEKWYQKVLPLSQKIRGSEHPITLLIQNNWAGLHQDLGHYEKALAFYQELQPLAEKVFGLEHPHMLSIINNLAMAYAELGYDGKAEQVYQTLCPRVENALGDTHPQTLGCLNNLATLYRRQMRDSEALPLYEKILAITKKIRGSKDPMLITVFNQLGSTFTDVALYEEAEGFFQQAYLLANNFFDVTHPKSMTSAHNMGSLYLTQSRFGYKDRYAEAEQIFEMVLWLRKEFLGTDHPDTLNSMVSLAFLYHAQGHYQKARKIYEGTIPRLTDKLGGQHPRTLIAQLNYIILLALMSDTQLALSVFKQLEDNLLKRAESQLYTTQKEYARAQLLLSLASFQDIAFNLALRFPSADTYQFAGNMILHWKQVQAEEQAIIAKLVQTSKDEQVIKLAEDILTLRARLARQMRLDRRRLEKQPLDKLTRLATALETKELALAKRGQYQKPRLQAAEANLEQVRAKLPPNSALLEFRHYRPANFEQGTLDEFHWIAMLLPAGTDKVIFKDLGSQKVTLELWNKFKDLGSQKANLELWNKFKDLGSQKVTLELWNKLQQTIIDHAAAALYKNLFLAFEADIKGLKTLYIAPESFINLIPLSRLILPDGRYWIERQTLRQVHTGRDLLREKPTPVPDLLLAIGGVNFGKYPTQSMRHRSKETNEARGLKDVLEYFSDQLSASRSEVEEIVEIYPASSQIWKGKKASEGRLKTLTQVPRVLHFATHAFYLENPMRNVTVARPLTLSGIALAGANKGLKGQLDLDKEDGILHSLEALGLNLNGTELVVFSACETGQGAIDYSEGVYGLVRAFKIAGAYRILMTLWPVKDKKSKDFMIAFYNNWVNKYPQKPNQALRMTQLHYINHPDEQLRVPKIWAAYVLVGP